MSDSASGVPTKPSFQIGNRQLTRTASETQSKFIKQRNSSTSDLLIGANHKQESDGQITLHNQRSAHFPGAFPAKNIFRNTNSMLFPKILPFSLSTTSTTLNKKPHMPQFSSGLRSADAHSYSNNDPHLPREIKTNNLNSNYFYLADKNSHWRENKIKWINSMDICLKSDTLDYPKMYERFFKNQNVKKPHPSTLRKSPKSNIPKVLIPSPIQYQMASSSNDQMMNSPQNEQNLEGQSFNKGNNYEVDQDESLMFERIGEAKHDIVQQPASQMNTQRVEQDIDQNEQEDQNKESANNSQSETQPTQQQKQNIISSTFEGRKKSSIIRKLKTPIEQKRVGTARIQLNLGDGLLNPNNQFFDNEQNLQQFASTSYPLSKLDQLLEIASKSNKKRYLLVESQKFSLTQFNPLQQSKAFRQSKKKQDDFVFKTSQIDPKILIDYNRSINNQRDLNK